MSKRSPGHVPRPRDLWDTPREAVAPLLPHLAPGTRYIEPCAGNGALISALTAAGHICTLATDLEPQTAEAHALDALDVVWPADQLIITNPPWTRSVLHRLIDAWPNFWGLMGRQLGVDEASACLSASVRVYRSDRPRSMDTG